MVRRRFAREPARGRLRPRLCPLLRLGVRLRRVRRIAFSPTQLEQAIEQFHTLCADGRVDCQSRSVLVARNEDVRLTGELYYRKVDYPNLSFYIGRTLKDAYQWLADGDGTAAEQVARRR